MRGGDITRSIILAMLAAAAIAAVATVVPRFGGRTEQVEAQDGPSLALDMDITNGSGPCSPVDSERASSGNEPEYKVAICLTGSEAPPAAFNVDLIYDDILDQCVPVDCPEGVGCLDTNPDANAGKTTWTTPDLGPGCDCSSGGLNPPKCDHFPGTVAGKKAFISCVCSATPTLPVGATVSSPIAVVTFKNIAKGRGEFTLGVAALYDNKGKNILRCPGTQCFGGARDEFLSPSPIPTSGGTPPAGTPGVSGPAATSAAATAVALGTPPSALTTPAGTTTPGATPGEEKAEGEGGGTNAVLIAGIVIGALVVVGGIGWFAWRRLRLR